MRVDDFLRFTIFAIFIFLIAESFHEKEWGTVISLSLLNAFIAYPNDKTWPSRLRWWLVIICFVMSIIIYGE
jgi:hypothetical protein